MNNRYNNIQMLKDNLERLANRREQIPEDRWALLEVNRFIQSQGGSPVQYLDYYNPEDLDFGTIFSERKIQ